SFRRLPFCSDLLSQAADVRPAYLAGWNEFRYCSRRLTCARRLLRCMSPVVAHLRRSRIADGRPLSGEERANIHRDLIITLAARHKLPAIYYERSFVVVGGRTSYGPDYINQYQRAAGHVDRILK